MAKGTAHTEVPSGGKQDFPPFQKDTFVSQLIWVVLIFGALYVLMSRISLPRIDGIMQARRSHIDTDMADARRLKDESDAAIAAYERELADARRQAQALIDGIRATQAARRQGAHKDLETTLHARVAEAERMIAVKRSAAMANVKDIAIEAAAEIVERLTGVAPARQTSAAAVARTLEL